jgi:hypothetical protein
LRAAWLAWQTTHLDSPASNAEFGCHTDEIVVKEIPIPTEKTKLVKLLMSLSEKYELQGSTISVEAREVRAVFRLPEHDLPKLREIANDWAERGYINAKHPLMLEGWHGGCRQDTSTLGSIQT